VARYGGRRLVIIGFFLVAFGCVLMATAPTRQDYFATFLPALFVRAFGQGLLVIPLVLSVTSGIRKEEQGITAGLFNMSQQLGGALGLAAVATVASAAAVGAGGGIAGEAHGLRIGFAVACALAISAAIIATLFLKTPNPERAVAAVIDVASEPLIPVPIGEVGENTALTSAGHSGVEPTGTVERSSSRSKPSSGS
jgi:MFS family permease